MIIRANSVVGLGSIPTCRKNAKRWLERAGVAFTWLKTEGGDAPHISLADLPEPERIAYLEREITAKALPQGEYDDAAHSAYLAAPVSIRSEAERRAAYVRILTKLGVSVGWDERLRILRNEFGENTPSKVTLKRYLKAVKGVGPINFAPALMPDYKTGGAPRVELSDEAFSLFMTIVKKAAPTFPLKQAWRDVRDIAKVNGLAWPSFPTVYRRWKALPLEQQLVARNGKSNTVKRLTQPVLRDKTSLKVLECVSLDGRTQD